MKHIIFASFWVCLLSNQALAQVIGVCFTEPIDFSETPYLPEKTEMNATQLIAESGDPITEHGTSSHGKGTETIDTAATALLKGPKEDPFICCFGLR